jgi:hypothetical protein
VYTGQKSLESLEVGSTFRCYQFVFPFLARVVPFLRDPSRILRCVRGTYLGKSRFFQKPLILPRWTVKVKADRAACRDFLGGNHSANQESVAEQHPTPWLEYAKHLDEYIKSPRNMAKYVVRKHRVKRLVVEREILRSVALFETRS